MSTARRTSTSQSRRTSNTLSVRGRNDSGGDKAPMVARKKPVYRNVEEVYDIGELLGTGHFSVVKLAVHKKTKKKYACKMISKERTMTANKAADALYDEVNILKDLEHPGVVRLVDVFETEKKVNLIMDLVTGGQLYSDDDEISVMSEELAREYVQQIASAVDYLHDHGIVHRDLKPENILVLSEEELVEEGQSQAWKKARDEAQRELDDRIAMGVEPEDAELRDKDIKMPKSFPIPKRWIKLADFGLAKNQDNNEVLRSNVGTPLYVAPEVARNNGYYGKSVDIWSIGVILYTILSGDYPFLEDSLPLLYEKIISGTYSMREEKWGHISSSAKDLIARCLKTDPSERYSVKEILKHPWIQGNAEPAPPTLLEMMRSFEAENRWHKAITFVRAAVRFRMGGEEQRKKVDAGNSDKMLKGFQRLHTKGTKEPKGTKERPKASPSKELQKQPSK